MYENQPILIGRQIDADRLDKSTRRPFVAVAGVSGHWLGAAEDKPRDSLRLPEDPRRARVGVAKNAGMDTASVYTHRCATWVSDNSVN